MNRRKKMEAEVTKLQGYIAKVEAEANKGNEDLKAKGVTQEEIYSVFCSALSENKLYHDEIAVVRDQFWQSEAQKHYIEIPDRSDDTMWQDASSFSRSPVLSETAIIRIRNAIKKERRDHWTFVIGIVGAIGGVTIGVLGLVVAIISK